jgi:hypothetical protein
MREDPLFPHGEIVRRYPHELEQGVFGLRRQAHETFGAVSHQRPQLPACDRLGQDVVHVSLCPDRIQFDVTGACRTAAGTLRRGVPMREQLNSVALFPTEQRRAGSKR